MQQVKLIIFDLDGTLVDAYRAIIIGDMTIDVRAGQRAKVKSIIVTTGSSTPEELKEQKPYRIIRGIRELLELL